MECREPLVSRDLGKEVRIRNGDIGRNFREAGTHFQMVQFPHYYWSMHALFPKS